MMFGTSWRNFRFFESAGLNDPPLLPPSIEVVSCALSHAYLFVGDAAGQVHIIDRTTAGCGSGGAQSGKSSQATANQNASAASTVTIMATFQAYTGAVTHMTYIRSRNSLATLGDDDTLNPTILRLWQVDQCIGLCQGGSTGGAPWRPPSREHRIFSAKYPPPSAAAGLVLVKVNQNEERLGNLRLRAGSGFGRGGAEVRRPASPTPASPTNGDGIPASSLLTVVVAFAVSEDGQHCAVALTNGECVMLHGDLEKDRAVRTRRIRSGMASGRMAFVGFPPRANVSMAPDTGTPGGAVTTKKHSGLLGQATDTERAVTATRKQGQVQMLFTVYDSMTTVWAVSATGECTEYPCYEGARLAAAGPGCACLSPEGQLVVCTAGDGALVILGPKPQEPGTNTSADQKSAAGRGSPNGTLRYYDPTGMSSAGANGQALPPRVTTMALAEDGSSANKRSAVLWHAGYIVLLSESQTRPEQFHLQCYDAANCIRALSRAQEQYVDVAFVLSDGTHELLVLSQQPGQKAQLAYNVTALREIDTLSKLDLLFAKECYGIAKSIADHQAQGVDPTLHRLIEKRYADYLYSKGKYTEAMDEYTACIGSLEPSYVIRRYMQSQHIDLLTRYLEELHQRRHGYAAHVSHTTLLLNCYIRQKDETKLLAFVRRDDIRFDAPNAIAVCRQGGYYEAALLIADKYAQVYERASILIHDLHEPKEALDYIHTLGVDDAEDILKKAGKQLIAWEPLRTTDILLQLCVQWSGPARRLSAAHDAQRQPQKAPKRAEAKDFLHVFVDSPVCLLNFLRGIVSSGVLEAGFDAAELTSEAAVAAEANLDNGRLDQDELANRTAVYNTLFELYITKELHHSIRVLDDGEDSVGEKEAAVAKDRHQESDGRGATGELAADVFPVEPLPRRLEQAMTFLEAYDGRYDDYVALTLCHQHHFEDGILFLLRKRHLSDDLINFYGNKMTSAKTAALRHDAQKKLLQEVELLDEREDGTAGTQQSPERTAARKSTWMTLLSLLVQSPQTEWQDVVKVLDRIESHDLLSPTVVMEILCGPQSKLQLRTVRSYCQRALLKQFNKMKSAQEKTATHLRKIEELKQDITTLQTTAVVFPCAQCAHCGQPLDFPVVHFLCRHSFHQRCLNVSTQCNLCSGQHRKTLEDAKEQLDSVRSSEGTDQFFKRLGNSEGGESGSGGFSTIVEYISKGALGPASSTSGVVASPSFRRPEASLFAADPAIRVQRNGDAGKEVYNANGDVVDAESVEWW